MSGLTCLAQCQCASAQQPVDRDWSESQIQGFGLTLRDTQVGFDRMPGRLSFPRPPGRMLAPRNGPIIAHSGSGRKPVQVYGPQKFANFQEIRARAGRLSRYPATARSLRLPDLVWYSAVLLCHVAFKLHGYNGADYSVPVSGVAVHVAVPDGCAMPVPAACGSRASYIVGYGSMSAKARTCSSVTTSSTKTEDRAH
jgi:hypothetical protein